MSITGKSIRTFIGARDYQQSKTFYQELGFDFVDIGEDMAYFRVNDQLGFYLQDYYVKAWVNNSMAFLEVEDIDACWEDLNQRGIHHKYKSVRLTEIREFDWGRQCFLHDPSGVLWHFGQFNS